MSALPADASFVDKRFYGSHVEAGSAQAERVGARAWVLTRSSGPLPCAERVGEAAPGFVLWILERSACRSCAWSRLGCCGCARGGSVRPSFSFISRDLINPLVNTIRRTIFTNTLMPAKEGSQ